VNWNVKGPIHDHDVNCRRERRWEWGDAAHGRYSLSIRVTVRQKGVERVGEAGSVSRQEVFWGVGRWGDGREPEPETETELTRRSGLSQECTTEGEREEALQERRRRRKRAMEMDEDEVEENEIIWEGRSEDERRREEEKGTERWNWL
jgi:hypothetical protein